MSLISCPGTVSTASLQLSDCIRRGKPDWLPPLHLLSSVRICILFFAILTTIYFFFFIGKNEDLIEFLLNRCHATRILTFDYIAYLLRQRRNSIILKYLIKSITQRGFLHLITLRTCFGSESIFLSTMRSPLITFTVIL